MFNFNLIPVLVIFHLCIFHMHHVFVIAISDIVGEILYL